MAPSAIDNLPLPTGKNQKPEPLKLSGILDSYDSFDVTPVIGREYPTADLVEWLEAPNSDELLRDLAITSTFQCSHGNWSRASRKRLLKHY